MKNGQQKTSKTDMWPDILEKTTSLIEGGGMKKGGLPATTSLGVQFALRRVNQRAYSSPAQRRQVFCMNQIGGIGAVGGGNGSRKFAPGADGVKKPCFNQNKK